MAASSGLNILQQKIGQLSFVTSRILLQRFSSQDVTTVIQLIQDLEQLQISQTPATNAFSFYKHVLQSQIKNQEMCEPSKVNSKCIIYILT